MSNAVMVVGGGLTGLRAALEIAAAGSNAIIVDQRPILGGKRAALLLAPDSPYPGIAGIADDPAITCLTLSQLFSLEGEAGHFTATLREQPRYVTEDCTRCNRCVPVCPQVASNEYDAGLTFRKAIHSPLPQTIPDIFSIDIDSCLNGPPNYLPCQRCVEACDDDAIRFDLPAPAPVKHAVAAVIVATGFADCGEEERTILTEFGYGTHPDIVNGTELQRLLEDPGPSGGFAVRPSDEGYPQSVLLVLTAVTREEARLMANHLRRLADQDIEKLCVLVLSAAGEATEISELVAAANECGAELHHGSWIEVRPAEGALEITFTGLPGGEKITRAAELVTLYTESQPDAGTGELAGILGLERDEHNYLAPSRAGVYLAGGAGGTVGLEAGAVEAKTAAEAALQHVTTEQTKPIAATTGTASPLRREDIEQLLYTLLQLGAGGPR